MLYRSHVQLARWLPPVTLVHNQALRPVSEWTERLPLDQYREYVKPIATDFLRLPSGARPASLLPAAQQFLSWNNTMSPPDLLLRMQEATNDNTGTLGLLFLRMFGFETRVEGKAPFAVFGSKSACTVPRTVVRDRPRGAIGLLLGEVPPEPELFKKYGGYYNQIMGELCMALSTNARYPRNPRKQDVPRLCPATPCLRDVFYLRFSGHHLTMLRLRVKSAIQVRNLVLSNPNPRGERGDLSSL